MKIVFCLGSLDNVSSSESDFVLQNIDFLNFTILIFNIEIKGQ